LLQSRKDQYYQTYSLSGMALDRRLADLVFMPQSGMAAHIEEDAYRNKVLKTFFRHGRLTQLPAQLKKRAIVLERIVQEFEPDRAYTEREVNQVLVEFNDDVASLSSAAPTFNGSCASTGAWLVFPSARTAP